MVALHEVLDDQLPVGGDLVGDRFPHRQRPDAVAPEFLQLAETVAQRRLELGRDRSWIFGQREPDESFPDVEMHRDESEVLPVQRLVAGDIGSADEATVQRVGPGVVDALDGGAGVATRLQAEARSAVSADVEERAQLAIAPAHDQHALPGQLDGLEVARRGQRVGAADTGPHLTEQALLLACVDVGSWKYRPGSVVSNAILASPAHRMSV